MTDTRPVPRLRSGLPLLVWSLIVVAVVARVGWAAWVAHAHPEAVTSGDTPGYLGPARALLETGEFDLSPSDDTPMFLRTPGYPMVLAAILSVTDSTWSISPIQAAMTALTVLLVVAVGRRLAGPTAGLVAGVVVALDPLQFALSGTILTESLAAFLFVGVAVAAMPVFLRPPERIRAWSLVALGTIIALSTLVRPTTYFFPLVVLAFLVVRMRHLPKRTIVALLVAFMLPIVVVVGGWMLRNHRVLDSWQVSGSAPVTLYCWHAAEVEARVNGVDIGSARRQLGCHPGGWDDLRTVCPPFWACDEPQPLAHGPSWDEMSSRGVEILREHPVQAAMVFAEGLAREIAGPGTDTVRRFLHIGPSPLLTALLFSWNALVWLLASVGAVVGLRSRQRWFWAFVIGTVAYVLLISAGANSGARFRAPLVPLLALLAAMGACHVYARLRETRPSRSPVRSPTPAP